MDKQGRISRRERQKLYGDLKTWIALVLAIVVFALIIDRLGEFKVGAIIRPSEFGKINYAKYSSLADSTIIKTIGSFQLADSPKIDIPDVNSDSGLKNFPYQRITQSWPKGIAFIYFVRELRELASKSGMNCDCVESEDNEKLDCDILKNSTIVSNVSLTSSENIRLLNRKVAIIFENLARLNEGDLLQIINSGLKFSYISTPDIFPSDEIKRIMSNGGVNTIITVPGNKKEWIQIAPQIIGESGASNIIDVALFGELLDKYPGPTAIEFNPENGLDTLVVSQIIEGSRRKNLAYLYSNSVPDLADSLAYLMGMRVIRLEMFLAGQGFSFEDIEEKILNPGDESALCLRINLNSVSVINLLSFKSRCDNLGIKLVSFIELARPLESL